MTITATAFRPLLRHTLSSLGLTFLIGTAAFIPVWSVCSHSCGAAAMHTADMTLQAQLNALAQNGKTGDDAGIALTFRLASEANRAVTGPLERFVAMVKSEAYAPLLDHRDSTVTLLNESSMHARYRVSVTAADNTVANYVWSLSFNDDNGLFMTDSVVRMR